MKLALRIWLFIHSQVMTSRGFSPGSPSAHLGAPQAAGSPRCRAAPACPALPRPPAPGAAATTALPGSSCQPHQRHQRAQGHAGSDTAHSPTACSTCGGCLGSASKALGYNLLSEVVPQPELGALALAQLPATAPLLQPQPALPQSQRSCGGTRQGGAGVSSRKPKPGTMPALCENQARSKVSNGQRK